jgi:hypothetical protein
LVHHHNFARSLNSIRRDAFFLDCNDSPKLELVARIWRPKQVNKWWVKHLAAIKGPNPWPWVDLVPLPGRERSERRPDTSNGTGSLGVGGAEGIKLQVVNNSWYKTI